MNYNHAKNNISPCPASILPSDAFNMRVPL